MAVTHSSYANASNLTNPTAVKVVVPKNWTFLPRSVVSKSKARVRLQERVCGDMKKGKLTVDGSELLICGEVGVENVHFVLVSLLLLFKDSLARCRVSLLPKKN